MPDARGRLAAHGIRAVCFDWGGTLMAEEGPQDIPMALWPEVRMIPGADELLAALHGTFPLCIATNASVSRRPMIERALERVGLRRYFSHVFCYTELGHRKESPEFWYAVAATLNVALDEVAMLGDTLEPDVLAPRALGVFAVWFNEGGAKPGADIAVPTITRLPDFLRLVR